MLEKFEDELLLILILVDQVKCIQIVIVLPNKNLPETITETHSIQYFLVILPDGAIISVNYICLLEHIEVRHVEHLTGHRSVLHASASARR